jgi:hypothetical protein
MTQHRVARIALITVALALPAAALAAAAVGAPGGGCWMSFCAGLFACGG